MNIQHQNTSLTNNFNSINKSIVDDYLEIRGSMGEIVSGQFPTAVRSSSDNDTVIIYGSAVSCASIQRMAAQSFIDFYDKKVFPFVSRYNALPFDLKEAITVIAFALQNATRTYKPSKGVQFTTYLYRVIQNSLLTSWRSKTSKTKIKKWLFETTLGRCAETIAQRVEDREKSFGSCFTSGHPPVTTTDINTSDMATIDSGYEQCFPDKSRHTCYMDFTPLKDFREKIEENEAVGLIHRAIACDVADKRRRKRRQLLSYVFLQLLEGRTEAEIAQTLNKKESQIRRWIRDIEKLASNMADAA